MVSKECLDFFFFIFTASWYSIVWLICDLFNQFFVALGRFPL